MTPTLDLINDDGKVIEQVSESRARDYLEADIADLGRLNGVRVLVLRDSSVLLEDRERAFTPGIYTNADRFIREELLTGHIPNDDRRDTSVPSCFVFVDAAIEKYERTPHPWIAMQQQSTVDADKKRISDGGLWPDAAYKSRRQVREKGALPIAHNERNAMILIQAKDGTLYRPAGRDRPMADNSRNPDDTGFVWPDAISTLTDKWKAEFGMRYLFDEQKWIHDPNCGSKRIPSDPQERDREMDCTDEAGAAMRFVVSLLSY